MECSNFLLIGVTSRMGYIEMREVRGGVVVRETYAHVLGAGGFVAHP
jgi:hypothetical protein